MLAAWPGIELLDVPTTLSRSEGDVHIYGNPHIHTSPLNGKTIAENICTGLKKISPEYAEYYLSNLKRFKQEIDDRTFGAQLTKMIGGETLSALGRRCASWRKRGL